MGIPVLVKPPDAKTHRARASTKRTALLTRQCAHLFSPFHPKETSDGILQGSTSLEAEEALHQSGFDPRASTIHDDLGFLLPT